MSSAPAEKAFVAAIVRAVSGGLGSGLLSGLVSGGNNGEMTAVGPFDVTRFYGRWAWHPHTRAEENKCAGAPGPSALGSPLWQPDGGRTWRPGCLGVRPVASGCHQASTAPSVPRVQGTCA